MSVGAVAKDGLRDFHSWPISPLVAAAAGMQRKGEAYEASMVLLRLFVSASKPFLYFRILT